MGNSETKESTYGYRIIKVAPNSPAKQAGLVEFLDYIIDITTPNNQIPFSGNYGDFFKIIQNSEDQETTLKVYNILYRKTRIVTIVPSKKWENSDSLLGALVRYEEYASAYERVLRIATVHENSPASAAGLVPDTDYLLGSPQYLYTDLNELANFIEMTQEKETVKSLELYVYNSATDSVRSTLIMPNKNWGGPGQLGCEFALGFLNHLPQHEDNVHVSNFAEDNVEKLDSGTDEDNKSGNSGPRSQNSLTEIKPAQDQIVPEENGHRKIDEPEPEKKADKPENVAEIRPPTSAELHHDKHHHAHDHAHDDHRAKLLHLAHQHKVSVKSIAKPFIKPGNSTANPFHTTENPEETSHTTSTNATHTESNEDTSVLDKAREELRMAEKKISQHIEALKETAVAAVGGSVEEKPKHAAVVRSPNEVEQDSGVKEVNKEVVGGNQEQEVQPENEEKRVGQVNQVGEEVEKRNEEGSVVQEKQVCKTTIEYNFFSKKLNKDYKIESVSLFNVEELERLR